ncbi:hypothetical protein Tco_0895112 [Tanacetum coccineum]|uniref:Uncharacterized protein n=1 Tax=Tanacetum coccineum TaxID=301880 RepID=A0ABQ5CE10_9ASTR
MKGQPKLGLCYPKDSPFDLEVYTDSDYAGASLDMKSTTGGCLFLGSRLMSWQCKKQIVVANSIIEAEDSNEKKLIQMVKIHTDQNVVDLLTKAFDYCWAKVSTAGNKVSAARLTYYCQVTVGVTTAKSIPVSPTIYVSCIEQFWSTAKIKTLNNETQIHAKVEGKTIVLSESSVRRDLQFDDEDADETITKEWEDRMDRAATTTSSLEAEQDNGSSPRCQGYHNGWMQKLKWLVERLTSKQSNDPPLLRVNTLRSGENRLKLKELMNLCTKLFDRVLDLETTKTAQAKEIASLKKRVKKLERKRKSKTTGMNLFKIGTSRRRSLGEEDASKQERNLKQSSIFKESDFNEEFDANMDKAIEQVYDANTDTVEEGEFQVPTTNMEVNTASTSVTAASINITTVSAPVTTVGISVNPAEPITTASKVVTTAEPSTPPTTTTTIFEDEDLTIAQTLVKMRSGRSKMKAELEEEERLARERKEDANIAESDDVQAMMDADYELAADVQHTSRE